jgi:arylsulfatase A-like enzyme
VEVRLFFVSIRRSRVRANPKYARSRLAALLGTLILGAPGLAACGREPAGGARPDVVLIVIDTLRADHLGVYGYDRDTSPHIDALASRGVVFTRASSPSSWTRPAIASLMTSRLPSEHGAVTAQHRLDDRVATLAEVFRSAGYRTLGVCANVAHITERAGFARGFDDWKTLRVPVAEGEGEAIWAEPTPSGSRRWLRAPTAPELNRELLPRLPAAGGRPVFLYVHYMDPHSGYLPASPYRERFLRDPAFDRGQPPATSDHVRELAAGRLSIDERGRQRLIDLYDGEIAAVDDAVGELLAALAERGYEGRSVIALVSDHGEEFGEHGGWFHGITLYHESLNVPFLLWDSRTGEVGATVDTPVDLLDVPTTLLALAGLEPTEGMRGRRLGADGATPPTRSLFAELHRDLLIEGGVRERSHRWAYTRWPWKVIAHRQRVVEFYRVDRDPLEREVLEPGDDETPVEVFAQGSAVVRGIVTPRHDELLQQLDPEEREALQALGYAD